MRELPNKEGARLVVAECRTRGALAHQLARLLVGDGAHGAITASGRGESLPAPVTIDASPIEGDE